MAKNCAQEELQEWFKKEQAEKGLVDIKFFPYADVKTSVESFSDTVLDIIKAEEAGRYTLLEEL